MPAIRRSGDPAIRRSGDPAIRRSGDPAIRRSGDPAGLILINDSARNKPRNQLAFIPVPPQRRQPSTVLSNRGETGRQRKTASRTRRTRTGTGRERPAIRPVGTGPCGGEVVASAPLDAVTRQRPRVKTHGMAAWRPTRNLDQLPKIAAESVHPLTVRHHERGGGDGPASRGLQSLPRDQALSPQGPRAVSLRRRGPPVVRKARRACWRS